MSCTKKIPYFRSIEEESVFWETHSPLDYGEWKEVKRFTVAKPLVHILAVRLDAKTIDRLAAVGFTQSLAERVKELV